MNTIATVKESGHQALDALATVIIGWFLGIYCLLGGGFLLHDTFRSKTSLLAMAGAIVLMVLIIVCEAWYLFSSSKAMSLKLRPLAVAVAMSLPKIPWILKPVIALFWMFHFLSAICLSIVLNIMVPDIHIALTLAIAFITTLLTYIVHGYLLICVVVFTRKHATIARVWKWRAWWALAHGVLVVASKLTIPAELIP